MSYEQENALLWKWGFHLAYDAEDAADFPEETNPKGEQWRLGSIASSGGNPRLFSRAEAIAYARKKEAGNG
jgi:hypothetical protein